MIFENHTNFFFFDQDGPVSSWILSSVGLRNGIEELLNISYDVASGQVQGYSGYGYECPLELSFSDSSDEGAYQIRLGYFLVQPFNVLAGQTEVLANPEGTLQFPYTLLI